MERFLMTKTVLIWISVTESCCTLICIKSQFNHIFLPLNQQSEKHALYFSWRVGHLAICSMVSTATFTATPRPKTERTRHTDRDVPSPQKILFYWVLHTESVQIVENYPNHFHWLGDITNFISIIYMKQLSSKEAILHN